MARNKLIQKEFTDTREAWCIEMVQFLSNELANRDAPITMQGERTIKISIAPISRAETLGLCYASASSVEKNINHIVISPRQAEPIELAHTLLHEMLHAFDDCNSSHGGRWKRWAKEFGMVAKGHDRNTYCQVLLERALSNVGVPTQHAGQVMIRKTKEASLVKYVCSICMKHAYIPVKVAKANGLILACVNDKTIMQAVL